MGALESDTAAMVQTGELGDHGLKLRDAEYLVVIGLGLVGMAVLGG